MLRIFKSPEAENDLDEIWLYIAQDNPDCAGGEDRCQGYTSDK